MTTDKIREDLFSLRDEGYRAFQAKLIPTVAPERIIGVRTPELRRYAKNLLRAGEEGAFLSALPHAYFDEDQLHAFILSERKDFALCLEEVDRFLPYVDNWATCDQLSPRVFGKHRQELLSPIRSWIASGGTYPVRFAVGMLMAHFLDGAFDAAYPEAVASIRSEEYYVRMMAAWYFATALAKQYDAVLPFLETRRLDRWTHNKAIAKALESRRIPPDRKEYLRSLKV